MPRFKDIGNLQIILTTMKCIDWNIVIYGFVIFPCEYHAAEMIIVASNKE